MLILQYSYFTRVLLSTLEYCSVCQPVE